jgi:polar amino acid transport system substrate-binding protein
LASSDAPRTVVLATIVTAVAVAAAAQDIPRAPDGTLRVAYLATNPAHAVKDGTSGELRGVAVELARELARTLALTSSLQGLENPARVIDAVERGDADVGFVAYNPERTGPVDFSQPYLLVQQTFMVPAASPIQSVKEIDRPGLRLAAMRADSIALYMKRTLKQAQVVEVADNSREAVKKLFADGAIDAFGANRQRLADAVRADPSLRLLPDTLYSNEQAIIVKAGNRAGIDRLNRFIDDMRRSGFIAAAIARSGVVGLAVAER